MKGYEYVRHGASFVKCTETSWPRGSATALDDLNHKLRYDPERVTHSDMVLAATVLSAWTALIYKPRVTREAVIRALRHADELADDTVDL